MDRVSCKLLTQGTGVSLLTTVNLDVVSLDVLVKGKINCKLIEQPSLIKLGSTVILLQSHFGMLVLL